MLVFEDFGRPTTTCDACELVYPGFGFFFRQVMLVELYHAGWLIYPDDAAYCPDCI